MKRKDFKETARLLGRLSDVTGFGFSLAVSFFLPIAGAFWLQKQWAWGDWVVAVAIFCGLLCAGCTFYRFVNAEIKRAKKDGEEYLRRQKERGRKGEKGDEA